MKAAYVIFGLIVTGAAAAQPRVIVSEPVLVAAGPVEVRGWGYYQFPAIERWDDGRRLERHLRPASR